MRVFLESKVTKVSCGCWIWSFSQQPSGYGDFRLGGIHHLAHRASFEAFKEKIPEGMHVLHTCDVPACINPEHLFLGTNLDNIKDSMRKNRRVGITRNRPSGLIYKWDLEKKQAWKEGKRKIKEKDRDAIRNAFHAGESQKSIAERYGVHPSLVCRIVA